MGQSDVEFKEVEICGHIYYLNGGVLFDRKNKSCWLEPISPKEMSRIILTLNDIILESEC